LPYARLDLIPDCDLLPLDFTESACDDWLLLHLLNLALQDLDVKEEICVILAGLKLSGDLDGVKVKVHTVCVPSAFLSYL
jgi:hypothetical protein